MGIHQGLLRWFTPDVKLVLTPEETIVKAQAQERVERLAAKLRELNIDPDTI